VSPAQERTYNALVAAAAQIRLDEQSVMRKRIGDEEWQREAWRQFDICGELRFAATRHAGALSQCNLYVAEIDESGEPGQETEDKEVKALGRTVFGGPTKRGEFMRQIDAQLYVGGESYVIAESTSGDKPDLWYVVSPSQIRRNNRGSFKVERPLEHGGGWHDIRKNRDIMTRIWTPHPRRYDVADSSVRSALPILREIERLSLLTFSQIDSRLISAGLLLLPQGLNFPDSEGNAGGLKSLMEMILEIASAQLTGSGTAAGLIPILGEIPADSGKDIQYVKFETALQAELKDKLDHAIRRLATSLDIDPQELLGMGDSNHWSAWQIDESGIKLFIKPPIARICDALTMSYLAPALKAMGKDPNKFAFWFDPSPLTVRPNRFEDALQLYDRGELSGEELRNSANFSEDAKPDEEELKVWRVWKLVTADPKLLGTAEYAEILGLPAAPETQPAQPELQASQGGPVPADYEQLTGTPQTESGGASPAQQGLAAAALLPGAEQVVLRALELAGGRLLDRHTRSRFAAIPKTELHTQRRPGDRDHARSLLAGAFVHLPALAEHYDVPATDLEYVLSEYCVELLVRGYAHQTELLKTMLERAGQGALSAV
jgi:hypothetical protein